MIEYSREELEDAVKAFRSSIGKCEKVLAKLKEDCWQRKWTERQLEAFYISVCLTEGMQSNYTKEQLAGAALTLKELADKCAKVLDKFREGSPQKTLALRRLKSFMIALALIDGEVLQLEK